MMGRNKAEIEAMAVQHAEEMEVGGAGLGRRLPVICMGWVMGGAVATALGVHAAVNGDFY